jgi:cytochrome c
MSTSLLRCLLAATPLALALPGAHAQDAAAGGKAFQHCADCHSPGLNDGVGPGLRGVFGRPAGSKDGFIYSPALATSKIVWNATTLDAFLTDPKAAVPGTTMAWPGNDDPNERADLIAYLRTLR